jgi:hypothetical protein
MSANPNALAENAVPIHHFARLTGVFFSPKETFADIAARPTWIVPTVVLVLFTIIACVALNQRMDWRQYMSQQLEHDSRTADLSAEQKEQRIEAGAKYAPIFTYVLGIPAPLVLVLLVAGVMLGVYNLTAGANLNYVTSLGILAHAYLPTIVSTVIFLLVLFLKPPGTFNLDNPVATNLGALVPDDAPKWLMKLGISFDIFSFWILILIAVGFAAARPKKLPFSKAFTIAALSWAIFVLVRVAGTWIFS